MQLLIVKGAKVDAEAVIGTPLQGAAAHGVKDSVEFLLKNQANVCEKFSFSFLWILV